jgi:amidohydrolase
MSASETFRVRVIGKGGHGAAPHLSIDPVYASTQIVSALQSIVSRNVKPLDSAVVSVTRIHGGEAFNVIPPEVELKGTIRTFNPTVRGLVLKRFEEVVTGIAQSLGCQVEMELEMITPAVENDDRLTQHVISIANRLFPTFTVDVNTQTMGSEDMAYMMQEVPGCYFFVGSSNAEKGLNAAHHHPRFDFDEQVLPIASALMAESISTLITTER